MFVTPVSTGFVRVNGSSVPEDGHQLKHGDRLAIGRAHIFRVVFPQYQMESGSDFNLEERQFDQAMRELQECAEVDPRWRRGVDAAVYIVKRDHGTKEANELIEQAKVASEVVAEANSLLKEGLRVAGAAWIGGVSHYELSVMFEADGPPVVCVVARGQSNDEALSSLGIWEAARFDDEHLPYMREAVDQLSRAAINGRRPDIVDWEAHAWSEIRLADVCCVIEKYSDLLNDIEQKQRAARREAAEENSSIWSWFNKSRSETKDTVDETASPATSPEQPSFAASIFSTFFGAPEVPTKPKENSATTEKKQQQKRRATSLAAVGKVNFQGSISDAPGTKVVRRQSRRTSSIGATRSEIGATRSEGRGNLNTRATVGPNFSWPARPQDEQGATVLTSQRRSSTSSTSPVEYVEITTRELYDSRIGVRLFSQTLQVSGFDVAEAAKAGWQPGDEIFSINGMRVVDRKHFTELLHEARTVLPITFTVMRRQKKDMGHRDTE